MMSHSNTLTTEQEAIVLFEGSAFITACPGAGKTRVIVARAKHLFHSMPIGRGIAFLSFTQNAASELDTRLRHDNLLPSPVFPNFIGTFDSFLWQFFIAPFGIEGCSSPPRLVPDKNTLIVDPYEGAHPLPLSCFCRRTGDILEEEAKKHKFEISNRKPQQLTQYRNAANRLRISMREKGQLDFDEVREIALKRIQHPDLSHRIGEAMKGRFQEVIVDEAQDCNPDDLKILAWFRDCGIALKVVCDPHQSIYEFRGGVTDQLLHFAKTFDVNQRLQLTGNFRSAPNICKSIAQLRSTEARGSTDEALGLLKNEDIPVVLLSYKSQAVPASIGAAYCDLLREANIEISSSPILASTLKSAAAAAGYRVGEKFNHRTVRLAKAVMDFNFAAGFTDMKSAIERVHQILLKIDGLLEGTSYHAYLTDNDIKPETWRPTIVALIRQLRFDPDSHQDARGWHSFAKELLSSYLDNKGVNINQQFKWDKQLESVLATIPVDTAKPGTIHSVKGMEFPSVCVVTTSITLGGILDYLESGTREDKAEEARKLYVAASRAQKLLVFAIPHNKADRLRKHLSVQGASVQIKSI